VRTCFKSCVLVSVCLLVLVGCGGGRYLANPSAPPSDLGIEVMDNNLRVHLVHIIVSNGAGSWVKDAPWHEYVVRIQTTEKSVNIYKVAIVDPTGVERPAGIHPVQLQKQSEMLLKGYKAEGISMAMEVGGMATSVLTLIPFVGPAANLASMGVQQGDIYADVKDRENIQAEFQKRRLPIPLSLSDKADVRGSIFFPMIPKPRALIIMYIVEKGGGLEILKMPLEKR